jgi:uncharacterized membrane protein
MSEDSPNIDLKGVSITLVVAVVVAFVGFQVMAEEVTQEELNEFEQQEQNITEGCMGVAGCGTGAWGLIPVTGIVVILSVILVQVISLRKPHSKRDLDDLQDVKKLYIEGEIDILELEERLDDEMESHE